MPDGRIVLELADRNERGIEFLIPKTNMERRIPQHQQKRSKYHNHAKNAKTSTYLRLMTINFSYEEIEVL